MSTKDADYRTLAAETFAALVPTDRVPVALLAGAMHHLAGPMHPYPVGRRAARRRTRRRGRGRVAHLLPQLPYDHPGLHERVGTLHDEWLRASSPAVADGL